MLGACRYISNLESRIKQLESPQDSEKTQGSGHTPVRPLTDVYYTAN
jgi:hypothetical protein